jgi:peptidoglycan/xylan/chitin deacetylase (PgdA/CDA1 family)
VGVDRNVMRRVLKGAAAELLYFTGAHRALSTVRRHQAGGRRVLIVGYHRVVEDFEQEAKLCIPGTLISARTFQRHLEDAHAAGYGFASLEDALDVLAGRRTVKQDLVVVTFDDGYRDVYRYAFPILQKMGIPSIHYLPTAFIGTDRRFDHDRLFHVARLALTRRGELRPEGLPPPAKGLWRQISNGTTIDAALDDFLGRYSAAEASETLQALHAQLGGGAELTPPGCDLMGWDEVRRMARAGVAFGAHTVGHRVLTHEPLEVIEAEVRQSKQRLEAELGSRVDSFAYCNGWYSDEIIKALAKAGFRSAVTTEDFLNRMGADFYTLKRKILWENFSVGSDGSYSSALMTCQLDDVFGLFNVNHPVSGRHPIEQERVVSRGREEGAE